MKTREVILRASGAILVALTLVLIPLSQAEATLVSCNIAPGSTVTNCEGHCDTESGYGGSIREGSDIVGVYIQRAKFKYKVTLTRPTEAPYCYENKSCETTGRPYCYPDVETYSCYYSGHPRSSQNSHWCNL